LTEVLKAALHLDARGWLMACNEDMGHISYAYATMCNPGVVKGWHRHAAHTDRLMCVWGMARIVTLRISSAEPDMGPGSLVTSMCVWGSWYDFQETVAGPLNPAVVVVPPGTWHAFTPAGVEPCVIVNMPDMPYDPEDEEKVELGRFPYDWEVGG
jgi:dTDP-4-dehydrorhamnose 3,5-epimerase